MSVDRDEERVRVFLGAALSQRVLTGDPGALEIIATALDRSQPDILDWGLPPLPDA